MTQGESRDEENPYQAPAADLRPVEFGPGQTVAIGPDENPYLTIWTRPRATIRRIVETDPNRGLVMLAALAGIHATLQQAVLNGAGDRSALGAILGLTLMIGPIVGLITIFFMGTLLRVTGTWLDGRATDSEVRAALAWGSLPTAVSLGTWIPRLLLIGQGLFQHRLPADAIAPPTLLILLATQVVELVLALWGFILLMKCLAEVHGFSAWKALGAWLLAVMILFAIIMGILLFAVLLAGSGILGRPR